MCVEPDKSGDCSGHSVEVTLFITVNSVGSVNRRIVIHEQVFYSFKILDNYWP